MDQVLERKSTMHRFVSLAQAYRGWSKTQTAERLGREVAKVVPESGNPKLDLVVAGTTEGVLMRPSASGRTTMWFFAPPRAWTRLPHAVPVS